MVFCKAPMLLRARWYKHSPHNCTVPVPHHRTQGEGTTPPLTLGLENFCSCLKPGRSLGCPRKPQQRQTWGKGGWLILRTSSASEVHVWLFSHPLQALPLLPCCIHWASLCIRPHHGSVQQETAFISFSQTDIEVYCQLDTFLQSHEKTMIWKMGLQTLDHASACLCICAHNAMWHLGPVEWNATTEESKVAYTCVWIYSW